MYLSERARERERKNENTASNFLLCRNALFNIPQKQYPRPYNSPLQTVFACVCPRACICALGHFASVMCVIQDLGDVFQISLSLNVCLSFSQEKLMYFPVCVSNKKRSEDETEEGLGSLPRNISSVSSLLLFNTTENL